jgi:hypothetical protein
VGTLFWSIWNADSDPSRVLFRGTCPGMATYDPTSFALLLCCWLLAKGRAARRQPRLDKLAPMDDWPATDEPSDSLARFAEETSAALVEALDAAALSSSELEKEAAQRGRRLKQRPPQAFLSSSAGSTCATGVEQVRSARLC